MKKFLITLLMVLPLMAAAQDNSWERVETSTAESTNPDAKYLVVNAVPEVDGVEVRRELNRQGAGLD